MGKIWAFRALDTLFFRDGTPFNEGETGSVPPATLFPPSIMPLQGAIRTCLARKQGWTPDNGKPFPPELGDPDSLGQLKLEGPYLRFEGKCLFVPPSQLVGKQDSQGKWSFARLVPGNEVECDLGKVLLPEISRKDGKPLSAWLTREGLEAVLAHQEVREEHLIFPDQLWKEEQKIGIRRNRQTRQAEDKHLYTLTQIRPSRKLEVIVKVDGIPDSWHPSGMLGLPLGGEGRFARVEIGDECRENPFPAMPEIVTAKDGIVRFTVSLLTPGQYENPQDVIRNGPLGVPGRCVSACMGKAGTMGGWDLKHNCPRPLTPILPAGSTWFFEAPPELREEIEHLHGSFSGMKTEYGMGQMVVGIWKKQEES
ncbi:type III-B CRISPR module-associated Cmr3 family protein [Lihuaxuella thermophila]|nr:type III-B CRISPR module-associated Cmr3 family protein [Lihuaxuella thermophila]